MSITSSPALRSSLPANSKDLRLVKGSSSATDFTSSKVRPQCPRANSSTLS